MGRASVVSNHAHEVLSALTTVARAATGGPVAQGGVAILIDHTGRMLFVHARYRKKWNLPGGFLGHDEDPAEGIRRELTEEVAFPLEASTPALALIINRKHHNEHVSVAQLERSTAIRLHIVTWELRSLRWCTPSDVPELNEFTSALIRPNAGLVLAEGTRWRVNSEAQPLNAQGTRP